MEGFSGKCMVFFNGRGQHSLPNLPFTWPSLHGPGTWSCVWELKQGLAHGVHELLFFSHSPSQSMVVARFQQVLMDVASQPSANQPPSCGRIWPVCDSSPQFLAGVYLTVCHLCQMLSTAWRRKRALNIPCLVIFNVVTVTISLAQRKRGKLFLQY